MSGEAEEPIGPDSNKIIIKDTKRYGLGLYAKTRIKSGEIIACFNGSTYEADKCSDLPNKPPLKIRDHAIQIAEHKWQDSNGSARLMNHSCEPNCGIKNRTCLVTMRDIEKGEELTWDYEMTENSDWKMICKCGQPTCRKTIGAYRNMPESLKKKNNEFVSEWLTNKTSNIFDN